METSRSRIRTASLAVVIFLSPAMVICEIRASSSDSRFDQDMLQQVQTLYGLDEDQAIERLAREEIAAETYQAVKLLGLKSYAGAWFDDKTFNLHVAISDAGDSESVERLGASPVPVAYSLNELEAVRKAAYTALENQLSEKMAVNESYIDYKLNQVVVGVDPEQLPTAEVLLGALGLAAGTIQARESRAPFTPSTGPVRGANGTRNRTWQLDHPGHPSYPFPCSIGASVEGGYVTAGHCGMAGNEMHTPSGQVLGFVQASSLVSSGHFLHGEDGGWVQTVSGWTPSPQNNGYGEGIFSIPAQWAGVLEAPVNTTVCRYGQTSGGPYCGKTLQKNFDFSYGSSFLQGFTTAEGAICTQPGDSGGPYVTASGKQVQGTNWGGSQTEICPGSPPQEAFVIFQPIRTTLARFGAGSDWLRMLTVHGAAKPTINGLHCEGGYGSFVCNIGSFQSQGKTDLSWTSSTGASSQSTVLLGTCSSGWVNVNLAVTNPYGATYQGTSFPCPTGPPQ